MSRHLTDNLKGTAREAASLAPLSMAEEVNTMSPRRMISAMFRQSRLIIGLTTVGILITAFLALSTPNTYRSTGTFLYTTGSESVRLDPTLGAGMDGEAVLGNASYVFQADGLLERVIDTEGMMQKLLDPQGTVDNAFLKLWGSSAEQIDFESEEARDAALKLLQKSLELSKPRNTDVLEMAYTARSPKLAQEILDVYMTEAKEWHLSVYNDKALLDMVEATAKDVTERVETAKAEYRDFLKELGVHNFQGTLSGMQEDVREQAKLKGEVSTEIAKLKSYLTKIDERLAGMQQYEDVVKKIEIPNAERVKLEDGIAAEKFTLTRYDAEGIRDPDLVKLAETRIKAYEAKLKELDNSPSNVTEQKVTVENAQWVALMAKKGDSELRLQEATLEEEFIGKRYTAALAELQKLEARDEEHQSLETAVARLSDEKVSSDAQLSRALRKKELAAGAFSSLQEIDTASKPLEKAGPNRTKLVMMGFFGGLFAALAIVLLRTLGDTVVRGRDDLDRISGIAVLGTFPRLDGRNVRRHRSLREQTL